jgi:HYDIN/CFA65/VesB-like, Ig-like domain/Divergent InlB B-repeat domain
MRSDKIGHPKAAMIILMFFIMVCLNSIAYAEGTLTVNLSGTGAGEVKSSDQSINCAGDCSEVYLDNRKVTLEASASENSYFAGWSGDACAGITKPNCSFTMDSNKNIIATFGLNPTLSLTKTGDGKGTGTVKSSTSGIDCGPECEESSAQFPYKKKITLTAKVDSSTTFLGWSGDVCDGITKPQCKILMDANKNITARFGLSNISVSPAPYDFGDVKVKQSSQPASFTISNSGMGNLNITKMEVIGADAKLFKIKSGGKKTITPGGQSTFSVTFTPSSIGSKAAVLKITSNDPDESVMEIALSGRGTDSILTASNAPVAASAVIQTIGLVGLATDLGSLSPLGINMGSNKLSTPHQLYSTLIYSGNFSLPPVACEGGGTVTINASWDGPDIPTDPSQIIDLNITMNFNSCTELGFTMNGKMEIVFEGPLSEPTKITISTPELTYANSYTGDQVSIHDLTITITDFTMDMMSQLLAGTITMTGGISGIIGGNPIEVECENFKMEFNFSSAGTTLSISGKIMASCLGDWITITTNTPIFTPIDSYCPTAGEIVVTSGEYSVKIVIEPDSKITVYYNDTLIQTYSSCLEVMGLCCSE